MHLDELIEQFLGLSERIAEAIISDENLEHVRQLDEQLSDIFDKILTHETPTSREHEKKSHFLIEQIVDSDDLSTRQKLADHLKKHSTGSAD